MTKVENLLRNMVTRSRIRRNGLQKILLCNDILPKTGFLLKHNAEDVEHEQKVYRLQPVGAESKVKLNGLCVSAIRHQISSDDEDENLIFSYTSDAQTRSTTNDSLPQERIR